VTALKRIKRTLKALPEAARREATDRIFRQLAVTPQEIEAFADASPRYRKLSLSQLETLRREGWAVGGHSCTHRTLSCLDRAELERELAANAADLARCFGIHDAPFAYPYGGAAHAGEREAEVARRAGFSCAFTTLPGENDGMSDRFRLRRMTLADLQQDALGLGHELGRQLWSGG
jgi:peptidoglycan/xylan/chitin deacetylase (PgdA/CDA1 family)